jgi:hypothetical protein
MSIIYTELKNIPDEDRVPRVESDALFKFDIGQYVKHKMFEDQTYFVDHRAYSENVGVSYGLVSLKLSKDGDFETENLDEHLLILIEDKEPMDVITPALWPVAINDEVRLIGTEARTYAGRVSSYVEYASGTLYARFTPTGLDQKGKPHVTVFGSVNNLEKVTVDVKDTKKTPAKQPTTPKKKRPAGPNIYEDEIVVE